MADKYQTITELYSETVLTLADEKNWRSFLKTACYNFRLPFDEQVLLYAQRPDATAVLEISGPNGWNQRFGRWVNRGATGIAVFDRRNPNKTRLKYYFDIADTHETSISKAVPIWHVQSEFELEIMETLKNNFGESEMGIDLTTVLFGAAKNAVEDNIQDYVSELDLDGSALAQIEQESAEQSYRSMVEISVQYMLLHRCGVNTDELFYDRDFQGIKAFDTVETVNALGVAVNDIGKMCLNEVARTVRNLQRSQKNENRTFANNNTVRYSESAKGNLYTERSHEHEQDQLPTPGRLSSAEPHPAPRAGGTSGEIRDAASEVSATAPESDLHEPADNGQTEPAFGADRPAGRADDGEADPSDGGRAGRDGEPESSRSDEMGGPDEQHQGTGGGNRDAGADLPLTPKEPEPFTDWTAVGSTGLQFSHHDFHARTDIDYYHEDSEKNELLRTSDALKDHRVEIATFFADHTDRKERGDFIKSFFNNTYVEKILRNGQRAGYRAWDDVLTLWRGAYPSREKEEFLRWPSVADTIYGMILLEKWLDPDESMLPSADEQISMIAEAGAEQASAFVLPQEAIDYILLNGSGVFDGKYRIYEQYGKKQSSQENAAFLKNEYGTGGHSDAIPGSGIWEDHDNLPELMAMFKEVADIQTAEMLKLPVPKANYHNILLKPSEHQTNMVAALGERAEAVRKGGVDSSEDNMLLITNDGRKLALDQRMLNPLLPDSPTSKVNACADNVFEIWERTAPQQSTQMVFCDLSTPKGDGTFNVYDDLRDKLVAKGIPAEEIAYIHSANSDVQKKELFGKVRSGQIRILLGSTQKMGAGTNVQQKLIALHHLDCPWRPSDLQQREGRIVRQGNESPEVEIYTYVTENTFDSYLYQMVEGKQKFIGQIMTDKSPARSAEDVDETALSYAEIKALCAGDPNIKEKMDLDIEVQRLKLLESEYLNQKYELEDAVRKTYPQRIGICEARIAGYTADIAFRNENTHPNTDGFSPMEIKGTVYTDKKEAGSAILEACKTMTDAEAVPLGQYRGFPMELAYSSVFKEFNISMKHELTYTAELGTDVFGNIQRIDNLLDGMEARLKDIEAELEDTKVQLENARIEATKPFPQEDELKEKTTRLNNLNALLNVDKPESEIVDGELDVDDISGRDTPDWER